MKKSIKLLILSLIISSIAYANTLSLDKALNIYYKKSTTVKNLKLDSEIRKETTKELENELNKNCNYSGIPLGCHIFFIFPLFLFYIF